MTRFVPNFVDPEELPYTSEELFEAARRFWPDDAAREFADHFAELGPKLVEARAERRAGWRAAGVPDADSMWLHAWHYPDELLPALASLSADAESRAVVLMEDRWRGVRSASIRSQQEAAAQGTELWATREKILRQARREAELERDKDPLSGGLAISLPPLPPPTAAMEAVADELVAAKRLEWEAEVARFRRAAAG